jgi:hypothetical protein
MMTRQTLLRTTAVAGFLALGLAGCGSMMSSEKSDTYRATLSASQEVPPNPSTATGTAEVQLNTNTNTLSWKVTYSGLSGPATAGHIHGPAAAGANAGVLVPFNNVGASPIQGQAQITPAQAADLAAGKWYVNLHTAKSPGGEIRGQLQKR